MDITENVIRDLLPAYFSGDASADTKKMVDGYLAAHPEMTRRVEAERREFAAQHDLLRGSSGPGSDHELETLLRTRGLVERQKWLMAMALMLSAFPLSFAFRGTQVTFVVIRDEPALAAAAWLGAVVLWTLYGRMRRRLRVSGLVG